VVRLLALWITGGPWQLVIFAAIDFLGAALSWSALGLSRHPACATRADVHTSFRQ
jgi:hypothetical protein